MKGVQMDKELRDRLFQLISNSPDVVRWEKGVTSLDALQDEALVLISVNELRKLIEGNK